MKLVVLTTETTHHTYFVQELVKSYPLEQIVIERNILDAPFSTHYLFEDERDKYEKNFFFNDKNVSLENFAPVSEINTANDVKILDCLKKIKPEIIVVFGTGKLSSRVIQCCPSGIINLHGGDPEKYRGLDSHLWAIYHGDFRSLVTTLHFLNEELDDGDVILQTRIKIERGMPIHKLRRYNTEGCIELTLSALDMYKRHGYFISRSQRSRGRYYSFMPSVLKAFCQIRFQQYTDNL